MRWGVPKQKRHCPAYGGISHQVIIVQKHKDFVIVVGQVIYQHRTLVCARTREASSIKPLCAWTGPERRCRPPPGRADPAMRQQDPPGRGVPMPADIPRRQRPDPCCRRSAPASDPAPRGTEGSNPSPSSGESCANLHAGGAGPDGESQISLTDPDSRAMQMEFLVEALKVPERKRPQALGWA